MFSIISEETFRTYHRINYLRTKFISIAVRSASGFKRKTKGKKKGGQSALFTEIARDMHRQQPLKVLAVVAQLTLRYYESLVNLD